MKVIYDKNCIDCVESHYGICEKHFMEDYDYRKKRKPQ